MRPEIPHQLEERIEKVYRQAGYRNKGDLVRGATRQVVNDLEAEHHVQEVSIRDAFDYAIHRSGVGGPEIRLTPKHTAPVRFKYVQRDDPPHTTILDTGTTFIAEDTIVDALEALDGVARAGVLTKGAITVTVTEDNPIPLADSDDGPSLVDRLYTTLNERITNANQRVLDGEDTRQKAYQRAIQDE